MLRDSKITYKIIVCILLFVATSAFALKENSDLQIQLGVQWGKQYFDMDTQELNTVDIKGMDVALENYNLFDLPIPFVSLGFMERAFFQCGYRQFLGSDDYFNTYTIGTLIGPAIGLSCGKYLHLVSYFGGQIAFKAYEVKEFDSDNIFYDKSGLTDESFVYGFGTGVQLKLFPKAPLGAVVGYRFSHIFERIFSYDAKNNMNTVYLGISINISECMRLGI